MLPVTPHHARHCTSGDFGLIDTCVRGIRSVFSLLVSAINATRPEAEVNDRCYKDQASDWNHDLVCSHEVYLGTQKSKFNLSVRDCRWLRTVKAATLGRSKQQQTATHRPNHPAFSAYIPLSSQPARMPLPKRKDIPWLTTISQNPHLTGPIAFHWIPDRERGALALSLRASLSCLSCFTPSLAVRACQRPKTHAMLQHPLPKRHQSRPNNLLGHLSFYLPQGALCALGFGASTLNPFPIFQRGPTPTAEFAR